MKIAKCFCLALAAAVMLSSCQKEGSKTIGSDTDKSVSISIKNLSSAPVTRASQDDFTPVGVPVTTTSQLIVLFANGDSGAVLETRKLSDASPGDTAGEYIFHGVPASSTQLAVTNVPGITNLNNYLTTVNEYNLSDYQGEYDAGDPDGEPAVPASLPFVPVWVRSEDFTDGGPYSHEGVSYELLTAGSVTVAPALARIEIGGIECTDLNSATKTTDGFLPRFGTLTISRIGIHNTPMPTVGDNPYLYPTTAAGETAFGSAVWNADNIDDVLLDGTGTNPVTVYGDEVFVYNIAPNATTVPGIILKVSGATWNTNGTLTGTPTIPYYVKSTGLDDVEKIDAGNIYRVNFVFACENVKPWNEASELICVDVTVTIPNWTIYDEDPLTPTFD